eukprot:Phypoly_transcript_04840.p1 GENE.Phypoly_transcript_04840~~Phypoly_transcript_04840.p1  ORF type:complete len:594 (+),score=61.92 Phypoly_transcript_04840:2-1783(+)
MNPAPNPKEAAKWKEQGDVAFKKGDFYTAASMYTAAIAYDDTNHIFHGNLSASLAKLFSFREAVYAAQKAVEIKPTWAKGHVRLALALMGLDNFPTAITAYQRAIALEPQNTEWKNGLAELHTTMTDRLKNACGFRAFKDADDLSRTFTPDFMEMVWPANYWWYTPSNLDNPRRTFVELWENAMEVKISDSFFSPKPGSYAAMGFSKDINIMRGPSVMLHPSFMIPDQIAFFHHCRVSGTVPDVILWAPDISVHYLITMITDEADMRRFEEATFFMTEENVRIGGKINKQKLKWQEELLQRAWREAMRVEELHPLTLILYYARHTRYRNQASEEKHFALLKDFISICAKMKIDGFRGLLEAKFEYAALLEKRKNSTEELKAVWASIIDFKGKPRHMHEQRFFAAVKNGALTNLALMLIAELKYDEAWRLYQEAFEVAITHELESSVHTTMLTIVDIFLYQDWHTHDWRFDEAVKFFKKARSYPTFPRRLHISPTDNFWPKVLIACQNPGEEATILGPSAPLGKYVPLAERLIPNKKLAVDTMCSYCHKQTAKSLCAGCKHEWYCNKECQKADWATHKIVCKDLKKRLDSLPKK